MRKLYGITKYWGKHGDDNFYRYIIVFPDAVRCFLLRKSLSYLKLMMKLKNLKTT